MLRCVHAALPSHSADGEWRNHEARERLGGGQHSGWTERGGSGAHALDRAATSFEARRQSARSPGSRTLHRNRMASIVYGAGEHKGPQRREPLRVCILVIQSNSIADHLRCQARGRSWRALRIVDRRSRESCCCVGGDLRNSHRGCAGARCRLATPRSRAAPAERRASQRDGRNASGSSNATTREARIARNCSGCG